MWAWTIPSGDLLLFVDQDDQMGPGYIDDMTRALAESPFVTATLDVQELNPTWAWQNGQAATGRLEHPYAFLPAASGSALGVQRQPFLAIGGFDAQLPGGPEDIDLCWRLALAGAELTVVADAVLFKRNADSFRLIFQQSQGYGRSGPLLYLKYRTLGMPRRSEGPRCVTGLAPSRHWQRSEIEPNSPLGWTWRGGGFGQVEGCIRGRVFYP